ncbi:hypothetical protein ACIQCJ_06330 [Streptomyces sp. NPDC093221]|uniref:hypothetical protein n=1 Tax=Streptomyces sp. NPDC093221 TaxID=3366032 RepID=UPI00380CFD0E
MIPDVPRLSRRSVVAVAAVVVSAGCSGGGGTAGADGAGHKATLPEPGELALRQAVRDSAALLARYDAVAAAYPALAGRLAPLRAEVALHVGAFGGRAAPVPTGSPSPGATSAATPASSPSAPPASSPSAALKSLADEERRLADSRATALLNVPGETARLFASVAAAGAGHVALLGTKGAVR